MEYVLRRLLITRPSMVANKSAYSVLEEIINTPQPTGFRNDNLQSQKCILQYWVLNGIFYIFILIRIATLRTTTIIATVTNKSCICILNNVYKSNYEQRA